VEGVELVVLDGLNLKINRPKYLLLEITSDRKIKTKNYLENNNYMLLEQITPNDFLFEEVI